VQTLRGREGGRDKYTSMRVKRGGGDVSKFHIRKYPSSAFTVEVMMGVSRAEIGKFQIIENPTRVMKNQGSGGCGRARFSLRPGRKGPQASI